jgi:hypothetical protein
MKALIIGMISFSAWACPELTGRFQCQPSNGAYGPYQLKITASVKGSIPSYSLSDDLSSINYTLDEKKHRLFFFEDGQEVVLEYHGKCNASELEIHSQARMGSEVLIHSMKLTKTKDDFTQNVTERHAKEHFEYLEKCVRL